ncbi:MAG: ABC transporter ATP-binding protein [Pirellulales bacterium]
MSSMETEIAGKQTTVGPPTVSQALLRGPHAALDGPGDHPIGQPSDGSDPLTAPRQLSAISLRKSYHKGTIEIPVLRNVDLEVRRGEFLAIVGQSGSGKSTLLHLLGTLDRPDAGEIHFDGIRIDNLPAANRDALRNRQFGMIFQFYHLLPELTMLENVLLPIMVAETAWRYLRHRRRHIDQAKAILEQVGLSHRLRHRPRELSGGEMQRAAIARALISGPRILFADEPTGNLDTANGQEIIRILRSLNHAQKLTIVMVTHDQAIAADADRTVQLVEGEVVESAARRDATGCF